MARLWRDRRGATAIEYALIAAGVSITIAAVVGNIGTQVAAFFSAIPGWFGGGG
ncbi:MAG: Flp family type IVb pilin [Hyphomicrobiales bacterium]